MQDFEMLTFNDVNKYTKLNNLKGNILHNIVQDEIFYMK